MGLDIGVYSRPFTGNEDRSWIGARKGFDTCRSITLDVDLFTYPAHFPNGVLPSGIALGRVDATGLYGPYAGSGAVDEVLSGVVDATGGTFTLTFSGQTTAPINFDASAQTVQEALVALSNVNPGDIIVSGGPGGYSVGPGPDTGGPATHPYTFYFLGALANAAETLTATATGLTGTTSTNGGTPAVTITASQGGSDTAATDGRQNFAGFLFNTTKIGYGIPGGSDIATAKDVGAPLFWEGIVKIHRLPTFVGTLDGVIDAAAIAAAKYIRFEA